MTAFSNFLENELLDHTLAVGSYTMPVAVYIGLYTSAVGDDNSGTQVSGGSYARQAVTFNAAVSGSTSNSGTVNFPTATASWGTVTHFGIFDAVSGGNLLYWGALTTSKTVDNGDVFTFPAGNLTVTLD